MRLPKRAASEAESIDVESVKKQFENIHQGVRRIEGQIDGLSEMLRAKSAERHHLNLMVQQAELDLAARKENLDIQKKKSVELNSKFRLVSAKLKEANNIKKSLEATPDKPIELEHLPTPLAKTVFGREEHFRLNGGRIAFVPLNALTDQLKREVRTKVDKLRNSPEITEIIGPYQGFHLQYVMHRTAIAQETKAGPVVRQVAELKRFTIIPMNENLGEPLDEALKEGSQFQQIVSTLQSQSTVVTVWTYPDSFGQFRRLKSWLYERGFTSAARPLPEGQPISGSPEGTRSSAQ